MTLSKDTLITADGGLHQIGSGYIDWKVGSSTIVLDGDFTIAELQWLINHMSSMRSDGAVDETQYVVLELHSA